MTMLDDDPTTLLSEVIGKLLANGDSFTDIHIDSGKPIMLRQSSYGWMPAKINDRPMIAQHDQIISFLNGVFVGHEERNPRDKEIQREVNEWKTQLHKLGSLHPALNLTSDTGISYRVRCTVQKQMMGEAIGLVIRPLPDVPTSLESLGLPFQVEKMLKSAYRGMIIVTGPTGSGKSTTLAAMISELNEHRSGNILTIEDPVEFVHDRKKCIINQREVGVDVNSFADGVRDALRFVPDVILIGEIRDAETMRAAVRATESGHLVLASMHAPTTISAVRKMMAYLSDSPADVQSLAYLLVGIVAQALVRGEDAKARNHMACEFLDCRNSRVVKVITERASGDQAGQNSLSSLEQQMISGENVEFALPMWKSLGKLLTSKSIELVHATSVVTTQEEKTLLMNCK